jgi:hypothetical protein
VHSIPTTAASRHRSSSPGPPLVRLSFAKIRKENASNAREPPTSPEIEIILVLSTMGAPQDSCECFAVAEQVSNGRWKVLGKSTQLLPYGTIRIDTCRDGSNKLRVGAYAGRIRESACRLGNQLEKACILPSN